MGMVLLLGCGGSTSAARGSSSVPLASATAGSLSLSNGWVPAVNTGMASSAMRSGSMNMTATGVAYAVIHNSGKTADELVGASTSVASTVQIHTTDVSGGVRRGRWSACRACGSRPTDPPSCDRAGTT